MTRNSEVSHRRYPSVAALAFGLPFMLVVTTRLSAAAASDSADASGAANDVNSVRLDRPFDFIRLQEFVGDANVTPMYWIPSKTRRDSTRRGPVQLYAGLDSRIRIHFDRSALAEIERLALDGEYFGSGRLSLAARIGDRPVEVQAYSEVGKDRNVVGPTKSAPLEFFLDFQYFQVALHSWVRENAGQFSDRALGEPAVEKARLLEELLRGLTEDETSLFAFLKISDVSPTYVRATREDLERRLAALKVAATSGSQPDVNVEGLRSKVAVSLAGSELLAEKAKRSREEYGRALTVIGEAKDEAERAAALTLAENRRKEADKAFEEWQTALAVAQRERNSLDAALGVPSPSDKPAASIFNLLSELESRVNAGVTWGEPSDRSTPAGSDLAAVRRYWEGPWRSQTSSNRTQLAFREVYRNLVVGQVVLARIGARPGDVLYIDLLACGALEKTNRVPSGGDAGAAPPTEPCPRPVPWTLAEIHVDRFGWSNAVADSFLLIKRVSEGDAGDPNNVENNFRPAPGVTLAWSAQPRPELTHCPPWGCWVSRNVRPSFGLNASFLTFDKSRQFEVGVGVVLGLFGEQVQVGAGINLNAEGGLRERGYYFLGLSFARLAERLGGTKAPSTTYERVSPPGQ